RLQRRDMVAGAGGDAVRRARARRLRDLAWHSAGPEGLARIRSGSVGRPDGEEGPGLLEAGEAAKLAVVRIALTGGFARRQHDEVVAVLLDDHGPVVGAIRKRVAGAAELTIVFPQLRAMQQPCSVTGIAAEVTAVPGHGWNSVLANIRANG